MDVASLNQPPMYWPQVGALREPSNGFVFRVWAPKARGVELIFDDRPHRPLPLEPAPGGYHQLLLADEPPEEGTRYRFRLDGEKTYADPASRWQPDGVFGSSAVLHPDRFRWHDRSWKGPRLEELVLYELHVGTFTPEGTFDAAIERLESLRQLGVTAIQLMPVAQFSGRWNWGYDGVFPFAVHNHYGGPHGLQRFVDACHQAGLAVILDVVYNHLGPEGNYFWAFGHYFSARYRTPWGDALNFDGPYCDAVRAFVLQNVRYWIREFHIDGLRLDAIHAITDTSVQHILAEVATAARLEGQAVGRNVLVIAESHLNDPRVLDPHERRGYGHDAQWADDFHHAVHALLTGERAGYYVDYGRPEQLVKCLNQNFVFDGIYSRFRKRRHGAPAGDHPGHRFVVYVQNHDQVGNRPRAERLAVLVPPAACRLAAALLLLSPFTPLLFMGEEYGETRPFPFFCDFQDERLRRAVRQGRRHEATAFGWKQQPIDPTREETFRSAVLDWDWREPTRAGLRLLYADLIKARRLWPSLRHGQDRHANLLGEPRGTILRLIRGDRLPGPGTAVCYFNLSSDEVRLGDERSRRGMRLLFTSEHSRYGGRLRNVPADQLLPYECRVYGSPAWWSPLHE